MNGVAFAYVALGGAAGACLRYLISCLIPPPHGFPLATLLVNLLGCFLGGVLFVCLFERGLIAPELRPLMVVGFLGALTTFSTFSFEIIHLLEAGRWQIALVYVVLSVVFCILASFLGMLLTRSL